MTILGPLRQALSRVPARPGASGLLPRTRLGGPMPWVMTIMVALTVLAGGAALALDNVAQGARGELAGGATVQVLDPDPAARAAQAGAVAALLREQPEVAAVRVVPEAEVAGLLEPWLGSGEGIEVVPLPALVDVTFVREADDSAVAHRDTGKNDRPGTHPDVLAEHDGLRVHRLAVVRVEVVVEGRDDNVMANERSASDPDPTLILKATPGVDEDVLAKVNTAAEIRRKWREQAKALRHRFAD